MSRYTIKTMTRDQLAMVAQWAVAEGWNPGIHDVNCFYAADPNGFFMGFLDGEPISSISAVKYDDTFGFLGLYIVKPAFRGRGYGLQIWQAGLNYLAGCNIGLDGVVEQQRNYIKSGFQLAHRNIRYEGVGDTGEGEAQVEEWVGDRTQLVSLSSISPTSIRDYDERLFLYQRPAFSNCWINLPQHTAIGLLHHNMLVGYGVLRPCQQGYKMGPLFADTPHFAEILFLALRSHVQRGVPYFLDVPSVNTAAVDLAQKYRMNSVFETARMYSQKPPALPLQEIFGITTFELG